LATLGLCFNQFLGLTICLECSCAIGRKGIEPHLHGIHNDQAFRINHIKLQQALSDLQVKESFDLANLPPKCPQIEGLYMSLDAYSCASCLVIRGTLLSIKEHHFSTHTDIAMPTSWTRVAAQQIHHQNRTPYFQVIPRKAEQETDDIATRFFNSLHQDRQKAVADFDLSKIDPRQVSTWLKATKWHVLIAPYDHQHLASLVTLPTKAELELNILAKAVNAYTCKSDQAIDTLSHLALCIINTPEAP
jgi:hypothetical protein